MECLCSALCVCVRSVHHGVCVVSGVFLCNMCALSRFVECLWLLVCDNVRCLHCGKGVRWSGDG